jgi:hypothetical protein
MAKMSPFRKYGFVWVTVSFFLISLVGHWVFAWFSYVAEQQAHQQPIEFYEYAIETTRDTLENWQSEFLQLIWQVAGLAFLLFVGSPQSREGDDRKEEKLDAILRKVDPQHGNEIVRSLNEKFPKQQ